MFILSWGVVSPYCINISIERRQSQTTCNNYNAEVTSAKTIVLIRQRKRRVSIPCKQKLPSQIPCDAIAVKALKTYDIIRCYFIYHIIHLYSFLMRINLHQNISNELISHWLIWLFSELTSNHHLDHITHMTVVTTFHHSDEPQNRRIEKKLQTSALVHWS